MYATSLEGSVPFSRRLAVASVAESCVVWIEHFMHTFGQTFLWTQVLNEANKAGQLDRKRNTTKIESSVPFAMGFAAASVAEGRGM
jgi:hypothetical protein